jgi:hypothetical protein
MFDFVYDISKSHFPGCKVRRKQPRLTAKQPDPLACPDELVMSKILAISSGIHTQNSEVLTVAKGAGLHEAWRRWDLELFASKEQKCTAGLSLTCPFSF